MIIYALAIGLVVGIIVGALGAGGGILAVPILVYLLGQNPHDAAAGSLVIVVLTAVVGIIPHARAGHVRYRDGLIFAVFSILGTIAGSRLSVRIDENVLMLCFAFLLLCVGIMMVVRGRRDRRYVSAASRGKERPHLLILFAAASLSGFLTGFFGVGGGFIVVPMLVLILDFSMRDAVATSLLIMIVASAVGIASRYGTHVHIDWTIVSAFALASMIGGFFGQPLSRKFKSSTLTSMFGIILLSVSIATLISSILSFMR